MGRRTGTGKNRAFGSRVVTFFLILVLAVGAGYAATKYIITPYFIGDKDQAATAEEQPEADSFSGSAIITSEQQGTGMSTGALSSDPTDSSVIENHQTSAEGIETATLYCIQYGSFQSKEGALAVVASLDGKSIESIVLKNGEYYKVIGTAYTQEDQARKFMESQKSTIGEDLFITTLEAQLR